MSFCSSYIMKKYKSKKSTKDPWGNTIEEIMERYQQIAKKTRSTKMACDDSLRIGGVDITFNFRDGFDNLFDSYDED